MDGRWIVDGFSLDHCISLDARWALIAIGFPWCSLKFDAVFA